MFCRDAHHGDRRKERPQKHGKEKRARTAVHPRASDTGMASVLAVAWQASACLAHERVDIAGAVDHSVDFDYLRHDTVENDPAFHCKTTVIPRKFDTALADFRMGREEFALLADTGEDRECSPRTAFRNIIKDSVQVRFSQGREKEMFHRPRAAFSI